ncbi:MAG: hypothetical protein V7L23_34530 [Nostoc sp.]|uniref:hypothetical protein n=1 Tax=Nostoc sp. TaxID=1180 RepID=UPI002FF242F3
MQIISLPAVFTCKTPTAGWLNLAQIRQLSFEELPYPNVIVTWLNGDKDAFTYDDATAIMATWLEASANNYRSKNRRNSL